MSASFDLTLSIDEIRDGDRHQFQASVEQRSALAKQLDLEELRSLEAEASLSRDGTKVTAAGRVAAELTQSCIASGEPVAAKIDEAFNLEFRPAPKTSPDEEVELDAGELDIIFHDSRQIELGKALVDTLALAIDPFPRSEQADTILRSAGVKSEEEAGPFGVLSALKDNMEKGD